MRGLEVRRFVFYHHQWPAKYIEKELLWAVITSNSQYDWVVFVSPLFYNQGIYGKVICSRSNDLSTTDPELIPGLWFKLLCSIYHNEQVNYLFHLSQHDFIYVYMNSHTIKELYMG